MLTNKKENGFSLVEVLVSLAIIIVILINVSQLTGSTWRTFRSAQKMTEANRLAAGGIEKVRFFRSVTDWDDGGLGSLEKETSYRITQEGEKLTIEKGAKVVEEYEKEIIFKAVKRDDDGKVDPSGEIDPDTVKVVAKIFWENDDLELITYLTNWQ